MHHTVKSTFLINAVLIRLTHICHPQGTIFMFLVVTKPVYFSTSSNFILYCFLSNLVIVAYAIHLTDAPWNSLLKKLFTHEDSDWIITKKINFLKNQHTMNPMYRFQFMTSGPMSWFTWFTQFWKFMSRVWHKPIIQWSGLALVYAFVQHAQHHVYHMYSCSYCWNVFAITPLQTLSNYRGPIRDTIEPFYKRLHG